MPTTAIKYRIALGLLLLQALSMAYFTREMKNRQDSLIARVVNLLGLSYLLGCTQGDETRTECTAPAKEYEAYILKLLASEPR